MPPAIVDSEDDDDEVLLLDDCDSSKGLSISTKRRTQCVEAETNDQRSGSTDNVMQQLWDAAKSLRDSQLMPTATSKMSVAMLSSSSLAQLKAKRRHTAELKSSQISTPERSTKRARTITDAVSNKKTASPSIDRTEFATLPPSNCAGNVLASSVAFTDHSDVIPSWRKPLAETIQDDFMNHEPAIMFGDTGSTIPDNESTQQRWLEQAVSGIHHDVGTPIMFSTDLNARQSSSFPWPTASQTMLTSEDLESYEPDYTRMNNQELSREQLTGGMNDLDGPSKQHELGLGLSKGKTDDVCIKSLQSTSPAQPPKGSPEVHIPISSILPDDVVKYPDPVSPASSLGQKIEKEPGSPAEVSIGLPEELYEPRPSRRRATFMAEEAIDYSVDPVREAKKRRKTTNDANKRTSKDVSDCEALVDNLLNTADPSQRVSRPQESSRSECKAEIDDTSERENSSEVVVLRSGEIDHQESRMAEVEVTVGAEASPAPPGKKSDDGIFKLPDKPSSLSITASSAKRSKRHHTTIFEDHMDFESSPQSLNLKQQQANRKSTMRESQKESSRSSQHMQNSTILNEEAEDELAGETTVMQTAPRKRGRPRKSKEPDHKEIGQKKSQPEAVQMESEKAPFAPIQRAEETEQMLSKDEEEPQVNASINTEQNLDTLIPAEPIEPRSPEVLAPDRTKSAVLPKGSPTSHSPINSSTKVPFRVGLSRHQRIPSLLRIVRPTKNK